MKLGENAAEVCEGQRAVVPASGTIDRVYDAEPTQSLRTEMTEYVAYSVQVDELWLYVSFAPGLPAHPTTAELRAAFKYAYVNFKLDQPGNVGGNLELLSSSNLLALAAFQRLLRGGLRPEAKTCRFKIGCAQQPQVGYATWAETSSPGRGSTPTASARGASFGRRRGELGLLPIQDPDLELALFSAVAQRRAHPRPKGSVPKPGVPAGSVRRGESRTRSRWTAPSASARRSRSRRRPSC